jgi:hypothetical protein
MSNNGFVGSCSTVILKEEQGERGRERSTIKETE